MSKNVAKYEKTAFLFNCILESEGGGEKRMKSYNLKLGWAWVIENLNPPHNEMG